MFKIKYWFFIAVKQIPHMQRLKIKQLDNHKYCVARESRLGFPGHPTQASSCPLDERISSYSRETRVPVLCRYLCCPRVGPIETQLHIMQSQETPSPDSSEGMFWSLYDLGGVEPVILLDMPSIETGDSMEHL